MLKKIRKRLTVLKDNTNARDESCISKLNQTTLFDMSFYSERYDDIDEDLALIHYYYNGCFEGRQPSYLFDPSWYRKLYKDVDSASVNALCHYIENGSNEGRQTSPYFEAERINPKLPEDFIGTTLEYFYQNERLLLLSAHKYFDVEFYLNNNLDIKESNISPYYHFIFTGVYEGRNPREDIDIKEYCKNYEVESEHINPFLHFITESGSDYLSKKTTRLSVAKTEVPVFLSNSDLVNYREAGSSYEEPEFCLDNPPTLDVKALAYYLPQFHPFEENNNWWGQGFTEWRNVVRGQSRFEGHYQPHLPKHLGYYDLRVKDVMVEQIRLAKGAGIHGFCFYHYWFNGKRIMEKPVNMLLDNPDIDMPFCIMWANENWTRTWDGLENDVLIAQDYLEEDDIPFIKDLGRHFSDKRYIRLDDRPLFFIYRPGIIPNAKNTIEKWRVLCKELLGEEPLFYMAQAFGDNEPSKYGMDGAIEFPPHKVAVGLNDVSRSKNVFNQNFEGHYPSYDDLISRSISEPATDFPLIKGVAPTWDNEARKPSRGMGFVGSTPAKYQKWLKHAINYSKQNPIHGNQSFVVVNAWNEWAEGAHLEPDVYNGAAYLNATYRALNNLENYENKIKILLVGHDAHKHGAQLLTLNIFKTLIQRFGFDVSCVLLDGGALVNEYQKIGRTYVLDEFDDKASLINKLKDEEGYSHAICNTTVAGNFVKELAVSGIKVVSLVHELETLIKEYQLEGAANAIAECAEKTVFASEFVKKSFEKITGKLGTKAVVKPQGIYQKLVTHDNAKEQLREKLRIPSNSKVILNSGYADLRKGFDLFVGILKHAVLKDDSYHFVWLGNVEPSLQNWILKDIKGTKLEHHLHILPFTNEVSLFIEGADVFAMTSREDPFPSVVLEALAMGRPVVGFSEGGGFADVLDGLPVNGALVDYADTESFFKEIDSQIQRDSTEKMQARKDFASKKFDWGNYVFSLAEMLFPDLKRVSVAVPNYNYEKYIESRLISIFKQNYPIYELIVLDDKSPDNSVEKIKQVAQVHNREIDLKVNKKNSGSVFKQWAKASDLAQGDFLWIAEADDLAKPEFLSTIMYGDTDFVIAYTDSEQIDENGEHLADNYRYYYDEGMISLLDNPGIYPGDEVIKRCLSIKNQFMNVSSIVFDKQAIEDVFAKDMNDLLGFKVAGDWYTYVMLLQTKRNCKLVNSSLNIHRRHSGSVTNKNSKIQYKEINQLQLLCRNKCELNQNTLSQQKRYLFEIKDQLFQG
jgi:glycosyltransferase involved in cell wall biosynthesis